MYIYAILVWSGLQVCNINEIREWRIVQIDLNYCFKHYNNYLKDILE